MGGMAMGLQLSNMADDTKIEYLAQR